MVGKCQATCDSRNLLDADISTIYCTPCAESCVECRKSNNSDQCYICDQAREANRYLMITDEAAQTG